MGGLCRDGHIASLPQDDKPVIFYMLFVVSGSDYYVTGSVKRALNAFYYILHSAAKHAIMARVSDFMF